MIDTAKAFGSKIVVNHLRALRISTEQTDHFRKMYQPMAAKVTPKKVIKVLHEAGVQFVLMGTHGIGGWRKQARATQDVDVLVAKKDHRLAVRVLSETYPKLQIQDTPVVTRLIDPASGEPAIDVMKPNQAVLRVVFRESIPVKDTHRIPNLEMALVSKFAAMVSPHRIRDKKWIDGGDFVNIALHNRAKLKLTKLIRLAEKVYPGGGEEIRRMIEALDAGRQIVF